MTAAQSPQPTSSDGPTRRGFLERVGVGTGAVVTLGVGGSQVAPQFSPVGRAQGIACGGLCIGAAAAGGGVAVGWALGEWDPLEDDSPPEGLTPDALENSVYKAARKRQSENASTFVDNGNILDGVEHAGYGDGKVAAIEALNEQETQSNVADAATSAADEYETTVVSNLFKSWNESVNELESMVASVSDHADLSFSDVFDTSSLYSFGDELLDIRFETVDYEMPNGDTFELREIHIIDSTDGDEREAWYTPDGETGATGNADAAPSEFTYEVPVSTSDGDVTYLILSEWEGIFTDIQTTFDNVRDGLITWVDGVYGEVQSGELNTEDLLTPRELAELSADEENVNQAIADLMALNIPVDLEREATITFESENETATLSGMLAPTTPPENGIQSGETYDPSAMEGDIYFNYDISDGSAVWTGYESQVDGGTVTFTSEPYEGTLFRINTTAGEEATVAASDFEPDSEDSPTAWTVDISEQVETAITEIDEIEMVAESGDTSYQTIKLDQEFTVEKIEDSDGNEADSMEFSNSEPQDDSNYITEEEWQQMQERNQELIDKYEDAKDDDGPSIPGTDELVEEYGGAFAGVVIALGAVSVVVGWATDMLPGMGD